MKEWITLSNRDMQLSSVLQKVVERALTLKTAAELMKLCYRQAKCFWAIFRREGPQGLAHQARGRRAADAYGPTIPAQTAPSLLSAV